MRNTSSRPSKFLAAAGQRQTSRPLGKTIPALGVLVMLVAACGQTARVRDESGSGSGGAGGSSPKDPLPLRVMNWNVQNLENDKDDTDAFAENVVTTAVYTAHRKAVGAVIAAVDADIVVLQEVENMAVLEDLNNTELAGRYTALGLLDANDPRGIDIAVLSKIPIDSLVTHKDDAFPLNGTQGPDYRYARDCVEIHVEYNGRKMVFLGVHFKAKANDEPIKRWAEAQHTRAIADGLANADPTQAIVVLGDFNDTPASPPYLAVRGEGAGQYADVTEFLPSADRWSYNYQGKLELIDYQMVIPSFAAKLDESSIVIRHGNDVDNASDHSPVVTTYDVN